MIIGNPLLLKKAADSTPDDPVTRSLRLASGSSTGDSSSHLDRNSIGTPTDGTKWTFSAWVKRSELTNNDAVFAGGTNSSDYSVLRFRSESGTEDNLFYDDYTGSTNYQWRWSPKLRDTGAFYNLMLVWDASQSAQVDKLKLYVNGVLAPSASVDGGNPPSTHTMSVSNSGKNQIIGNNSINDGKANLLIADVYFLDGVAKTVTDGVTDFTESNGYGGLKPKEYTGTDFGNNGFHLEFEDYGDHSLIGLDSSLGGAINWDTSKYRSGYGSPSWSESNTQFDGASGNVQHTMSNFAGSGKYYAEFEFTSGSYSGSSVSGVGPVPESWWTGSTLNSYMYSGTDAARKGCAMIAEEKIKSPTGSDIDCSNTGSEPHFTVGTDRIGIEVDGTANTAVFYRVNSSEKVEIASLNNTDDGIDFGGKVAWGCTIHDANHSIRGYFTSASWLQSPSSGYAAMPSGNHFEPTNLSSHDILLDTPTKNYATLNPLQNTSSTTLSEGNLKSTWDSGSSYNEPATVGAKSGKFYFEVYVPDDSATTNQQVGVVRADTANTVTIGSSSTNTAAYMANQSGSNSTGFLQHNGSTTAFGSRWDDASHIVQCAFDADTGKVWFGLDNTWQNDTSGNTPNLALGTYPAVTLSGDEPLIPAIRAYGAYMVFNGGSDPSFAGYKTSGQDTSQSEFYYAPPEGFKSLNTSNLDDPIKPAEHFDVLTYNGNSDLSNASGSTQNVTGVNFDVGMAWIKDRDNSSSGYTYSGSNEYGHYLFDTITGTSTGGYNLDNDVVSSGSGAYLNSGYYGVTSFSAGSGTNRGITVDEAGETNFDYNDGYYQLTERYVAWLWKLGSTGSSSTWNSSYTAPTTEHYNASAGVTTIEVSPVSSGNLEVAHSLSAAPEFFFVGTDGYANFSGYPAFHKDLDSGKYLQLDGNSAQSSDSTYFPSGAAHADYIKLGSAFIDDYGYGFNLRIWAFTGVEGYSQFGKYTGNGSSDGTYIYLGFKPAFFLIKYIDGTSDWYLYDSARNTSNLVNFSLKPNSSSNETTYGTLDINSNGVKMRISDSTRNGSGQEIIYAAFAESPFKYANAR